MRRLAFALLLLAGCRSETPPAADTGAKDAAVAWFTTLANGDPPAAHAMLDDESRRSVPADAFARRAQAWRQKVGYKVDRVHIRACEENGDSATAHVTLIGRSAGHSRRFEDAIMLRLSDGKWFVMAPAAFTRP